MTKDFDEIILGPGIEELNKEENIEPNLVGTALRQVSNPVNFNALTMELSSNPLTFLRRMATCSVCSRCVVADYLCCV